MKNTYLRPKLHVKTLFLGPPGVVVGEEGRCTGVR